MRGLIPLPPQTLPLKGKVVLSSSDWIMVWNKAARSCLQVHKGGIFFIMYILYHYSLSYKSSKEPNVRYFHLKFAQTLVIISLDEVRAIPEIEGISSL